MLGNIKSKLNSKTVVLLTLLVLGIIRSIFVFIPSLHVDMAVYQGWSALLLKSGIPNFYVISHSDYFPGYLYLLYILGFIFNSITHLLPTTYFFEIFLKFFNGLFDISTAYLIFLILNKYKSKLALIGSLIYLFNPITIFSSLVWGQSDSVAIFFIVLSVFAIIELKNYLFWIVIFGFTILVKPQAILILPLLFLVNQNKKKFLIYTLLSFVSALVISIPFFPKNILFGLIEQFKISTNIYPFTSIYADNFWQFFGWFKSDQTMLLFLNLQQWGLLLFAFALTLITFIYLKTKNNSLNIYLGLALYFIAFFLFLTRLHERYLIYAFPFLLLSIILLKTKRSYFYFAVLSLIHFANTWFVYTLLNYTDFVNNNFNSIVFVVLKSKLLPIATIIIFILLLIELYKYPSEFEKQKK